MVDPKQGAEPGGEWEEVGAPDSWIAPTLHGVDVGDGDPGLVLERARSWDRDARSRYGLGDRTRAAASWERSVPLYRAAGRLDRAAAVLANIATCYRDLVQFHLADVRAREARELAEGEGIASIQQRSLEILVDCAIHEGRFEDAAAWLERVPAPWGPSTWRRRALLALRAGAGDAEAHAREALARARQAGVRSEEVRCGGILAAALAASGRGEAALELLEELGVVAQQLAQPFCAAELGLWGAEVLAALGRSDEARARAEQVLLYAEDVGYRLLAREANRLVEAVRERSALARQRARLQALVQLAVAVGGDASPELLLDRIARHALQLMDMDRAFVVLGSPENWRVAASATRHGPPPGRPNGSVVRLVLGQGREVAITEGSGVDPRISVTDHLPATVLSAPLPAQDDPGAIYVDRMRPLQGAVEEQLELLSALGAFAAVATIHARQLQRELELVERLRQGVHDIRHHAAAAGLWLDAAEEDLPGAEALDAIHTAREALNDIAEAAGHMLGAKPPDARRMELEGVLGRAVQLHREQASSRGVEVALDVRGEPAIVARPGDLLRVVSNLLVNAVKFSPRGGRVLVQASVEGGTVMLSVADQGPGIPPGKRREVFRPGVALPGRQAGFGLGLSIVDRLVREMGGRVDVHNRAEGGAIFLVRLPAA